MFLFASKITEKELENIKIRKINVTSISDEDSGSSVLIINIKGWLTELPFNANIYHDDRVTKYLSGGNSICIIVIDTYNYIVKAIRIVTLNRPLRDRISSLWNSAIEKNVSKDDYINWYNSEVISKNVDANYAKSNKLGYIKGGYTVASYIDAGLVDTILVDKYQRGYSENQEHLVSGSFASLLL